MEDNRKISWKENFRINRRAVWLWCREYPALFISTGLFSLTNALSPYVAIYFSAQIINELAGMKRKDLLIHYVVTLLLTEAAALLVNSLLGRWKNALSAPLHYYNEKRISDKLLSMDFCVADDNATYEKVDSVFQTENWGGWGLGKIYYQFQKFLEEFFKMLGGLALSLSLFILPVADEGLAFLNHPLCILLLLLLLMGVIVVSPYLETIGNRFWTESDEEIKLSNRLYFYVLALSGQQKSALDIRIYRQDIMNTYFFEQMLSMTNDKFSRYAKGKMGFAFALSAIASRVFMGIVYLFVCLKAWGGAFGIGSVTQYISAITALAGGIGGMLKVLGEAGLNAVFLKEFFEFLDIPNRMYQGSLTVEKRSDKNYEIEFRNVSFRYPGTESYALKDVSLKFKVGRRLAVVGQNGSGKTTFIKLLCRLYDPVEGQILLNGIDIRKYNYREYLNVFSVVFQDFKLLSFPLGQNIATGQVYEMETAKECLEKAGIWERVRSMKNGLDTFLYKDMDEGGVQISGGEEQKIAIARALYQDAPFLILDEPTAALDPVAEYEIYTRLDEIVEDRTAIYISHRLASCRFCDEIVVFHEGRMVQKGSHEELVSCENGKYRELWEAQAQYYAES